MHFTFFLKKRRFLIFLILALLIYFFSSSYFDSSVFEYVEIKSQRYFEEIVNDTVKDSVVGEVDGSLMKVEYASDNTVSYSYMDVHKALSIKTKASDKTKELVERLEDQEDFKKVTIPLGYFFTKNILLTDGIKLPVKLRVFNAFDTEIKPVVESYGINSSLIQIYLVIKFECYIQIPFQKKKVTLEDKILLSTQIINAQIPKYYFYGADVLPYSVQDDNS